MSFVNNLENTDLVTFTVSVDGSQIPDTISLLSINVRKEINRVGFAQLVISDGDTASEDFEISNTDYFIPGKELEIKAGYHSQEETIFKGVVVKQSIRVRAEHSRLVVDCRDACFKLTQHIKNRVFEEVTDSDALEDILNETSIENDIAATTVQHLELIQYQSTDWDFILDRASANSMVCLSNDNKLSIQSIDFSAAPVLECLYGSNIYEMDLALDARAQYESVKAITWDMDEQALAEAEGQEPGFESIGNLSPTTLAEALDQKTFSNFHGGNIQADELQSWADATLLQSRMAQVQGRIKTQGYAQIKPGDWIKISGAGDRFSGKAYASGIQHQIVAGNWTTNIQVGFSTAIFLQQSKATGGASALLSSVKGLQLGKVTALEGDPEGAERIKVKIPIVDGEADGLWARLSCLDAGENRGTFFRPEIDDEVIIGFINDDPRDAVVLGMLHSSVKPVPESITDDNHLKGYTSREKLKFLFDDEKKIITLETPAGNIIKLDEDEEAISMEDQNKNKIVMDSDGILIESSKDIILKTSSGDVKVEGLNIEHSAQISLKVEGASTAEISSGATTTVKGGIVQIN